MGRWVGFLGVIGLVLFLFGVLAGFAVGGFDLPVVMVHLSLGGCAILLWFALAGMHNFRVAQQALVGRRARYGVHATLTIALFTALLVFANWYASKYDRRYDLTDEGMYSLSPQSKETLAKLDKPLKLVAFNVPPQFDQAQARELLELYRYNNPERVSYEIVDPQSKPHLTDRYQMTQGNLLYIGLGDEENVSAMRLNEINEEQITNAILKLTRGAAKSVYIVQGHGEPDIDGSDAAGIKSFVSALGDENLKVEPLILAEKEKVPEDAAAVLLIAPKKSLLPAERQRLIEYAERGGRLLLATDPLGTSDVPEIAKHFGIAVRNDVVIDPQQRLMTGPVLSFEPLVVDYGSHPAAKDFGPRSLTVYRIASSVGRVDPSAKAETDTYIELAQTSRFAWGEINLEAVFNEQNPSAEFQGSDNAGPVAIAMSVERKLKTEADETKAEETPSFEAKARVIVFGDSDWLTNQLFGHYFNRDLALNVVNWLSGEEGGITIRPKSVKVSQAPIPERTFITILAASFLVPEFLLLLGLAIWWRRRARSIA